MKRRRNWFFFFFSKSLSQRKGRVIIASLSVMLAVTIITGMIGITAGIKDKLGSELKSYGANIIVSPLKGNYIQYEFVHEISKIADVEDATGQVFGNIEVKEHVFEVIGLDIDKVKEKGWRFSGKWPDMKGDIIAGVNLRDAFKFEEGSTVLLGNEGRKKEFKVSGFIEKGGPEDSAFIMSIREAWELTGADLKLNAILVRGKSGKLDNVVKGIKDIMPSATVKTFRQVAFAEESLLVKIQLLMVLVTVVVLFATAISVASTMGANVLERREEIGLMKALGATRNEISTFYMAEALLIGIIGGVTGFLFGFLAAQAISKGAFNSFVSIKVYLPFVSLFIGLIVSLVAGYFPVRDAIKYDPAVILRGE